LGRGRVALSLSLSLSLSPPLYLYSLLNEVGIWVLDKGYPYPPFRLS
jgi:hypothetical protein